MWKGNKERSFGPYTDELWAKVKPADPWATPSQISDLEKRMHKVEKSKRRVNTSFDAEILKRVKQLEESQLRADVFFDIFTKMRMTLILSARRRLNRNTACKHMDKNGICNYWSWSCHAKETPEYLRPMKRDEIKGKIVYRVNVIEHPLFCSACPSYEPKR